MILGDIADGLTRGAERAGGAVSQALFEPTIRLGVTGLSRAGKTVFITALVANLLNAGRLPGLRAAADGRLLAAFLQPQPDDTVPRFDYETHLAAMTGNDPHWPESTRAVSQLRLSLRIKPGGLLAGLQAPRVIHIDIVDYPGEWLLDLELLDLSYGEWSARVFTRLENRDMAEDFRAKASAADALAKFDEDNAKSLTGSFASYLKAARNAGFSDCTPGRFLLPGDLEGSPALTFAPLPPTERAPRGSLIREMARRFEAYKRGVVKPFFRDHFARIDRQIVLVDVLDAIANGPRATEDLRRAMTDTLAAMRPGRNSFLSRLFVGRRIDRILFAATKADHLHQTQHQQLSAIMAALLQDARTRADFAGARTDTLALAALRATVEEAREIDGEDVPLVRGTLLDGRHAAFHPGTLPDNPTDILNPARDEAETWLNAEYSAMKFAPPAGLSANNGLPHIRLDRALEFLIGDRL